MNIAIALAVLALSTVDPLVIDPSSVIECSLVLYDKSGDIVHSSPSDCDDVPIHEDGECTIVIETDRKQVFYRSLAKCPEGDD